MAASDQDCGQMSDGYVISASSLCADDRGALAPLSSRQRLSQMELTRERRTRFDRKTDNCTVCHRNRAKGVSRLAVQHEGRNDRRIRAGRGAVSRAAADK